jgi:hypothetical protein
LGEIKYRQRQPGTRLKNVKQNRLYYSMLQKPIKLGT